MLPDKQRRQNSCGREGVERTHVRLECDTEREELTGNKRMTCTAIGRMARTGE